MGRVQAIKNSFIGGELSPFMLGRTDMDKYASGCEKISNFVVKTTGGVTRRIGTTYLADAAGPSRLIPFVISNTLSYVLEFGNGTLRFYTKHTQIQTALGIPYQINTPYSTLLDDLWDIKFTQIASVMFITHPNHPPQKLIRVNDTSWFLVQPSFYAAPATKQDQDIGTPVGVSITVAASTVIASSPIFIQGDVGKAVVAGIGVGYISIIGGASIADPITGATLFTNATISVVDGFDSGAYAAGSWKLRGGPLAYFSVGVFNAPQWKGSNKFAFGKSITIRSTTIEPTDNSWQNVVGGVTANVTYTGGFTDAFRSIDNNSYVPFAGGYCLLTSITNSTSAIATVLAVPSQTESNAWGNPIIAPTPPGGWWLEAPEFVLGNYPRCVTMFQDRVWFGSTPNNPQAFWGSVIGDYENFAKGTLDTDGIQFTINSGKLDQILWMIAFQGSMVAGTYQGEYLINGGVGQSVQSPGVPITPTNIDVIRQSTFGDSRVQALLARADVLYVQRTGTEVYEFTYNALTSAYDSKNLTHLAETIVTGQIKELVYQDTPFKVVWAIDTGNNLIGMTYEKPNDVYAWHRHFTGVDGGDSYNSVCVIPSNDVLNAQQDDIYFNVKRLRNGVFVYTIEFMDDQAVNLDCASHTVFANPVNQIGNLQYLRGRTISVVADGALLPSVVMDGTGNYTFPAGFSAKDVQAGLMFISELLTVRFELGKTQGLIKRWLKLWARLYNTLNIAINNQRVPFRTTAVPLDQATPIFTGDVPINTLGFDRDARIDFIQDQPFDCNILCAFGNIEVSDGV